MVTVVRRKPKKLKAVSLVKKKVVFGKVEAPPTPLPNWENVAIPANLFFRGDLVGSSIFKQLQVIEEWQVQLMQGQINPRLEIQADGSSIVSVDFVCRDDMTEAQWSLAVVYTARAVKFLPPIGMNVGLDMGEYVAALGALTSGPIIQVTFDKID